MEQNDVCVTAPIDYGGWVDHKSAIAMFAALGQETRFAAFLILVQEPDGLASGEIAERLNVPQNTASVHLQTMSRAGLVSSERRSRSIIYRAERKAAKALEQFLASS